MNILAIVIFFTGIYIFKNTYSVRVRVITLFVMFMFFAFYIRGCFGSTGDAPSNQRENVPPVLSPPPKPSDDIPTIEPPSVPAPNMKEQNAITNLKPVKRTIADDQFYTISIHGLLWMTVDVKEDAGYGSAVYSAKGFFSKKPRLYTFDAANRICESQGGRLPTYEEWFDLIKAYEDVVPLNEQSAPFGFNQYNAFDNLVKGRSSGAFNALLNGTGSYVEDGNHSFEANNVRGLYHSSDIQDNLPVGFLFDLDNTSLKPLKIMSYTLGSCRCVFDTNEYLNWKSIQNNRRDKANTPKI